MKSIPSSLWVDLIGKPFAFHGRGPESYDCLGLVLELYRRNGIIIPDVIYDEDEHRQSELFQANLCHWLPCERRPGCVILFRRGRAAQHVGYCIDDDRFIHAQEDMGQVVISRMNGLRNYTPLILGCYDYAV